MTEKRKSYDLKFKQSVIKFAEENSNREAGRKFSIYYLSIIPSPTSIHPSEK